MEADDSSRIIEAATLRAHRLRREASARFWRDLWHALLRLARARNQARRG